MVDRLLVNLTDDERQLLLDRVELPPRLQSLIKSAKQGRRGWGLTLSTHDADKIRSHCGDTLSIIGFDEHHEPTKDGLLLENMIDRFFTG